VPKAAVLRRTKAKPCASATGHNRIRLCLPAEVNARHSITPANNDAPTDSTGGMIGFHILTSCTIHYSVTTIRAPLDGKSYTFFGKSLAFIAELQTRVINERLAYF